MMYARTTAVSSLQVWKWGRIRLRPPPEVDDASLSLVPLEEEAACWPAGLPPVHKGKRGSEDEQQ